MDNNRQASGLELIEDPDITPEIDDAVKRLLCECFPDDAEEFSSSRYWHKTAPAYMVIYRQGNEVVGHAAVVMRTIRCGDVDVDIAGVQGVAVSPRSQGTMLAWALMRRSIA